MEKYKFADICIIDDSIPIVFHEFDSMDLELPEEFTEDQLISAAIKGYEGNREYDEENLYDKIVGMFRNHEYTEVVIDGDLYITMHILTP